MSTHRGRDSSRALVVGAGIVGVCSALALRRAGFEVTLVDRKDPGEECSRGNAGAFAVAEVMPLSTPGMLWKVPGWLLDPLGPLSIRWRYLPHLMPWLWRYWRAGSRERVEQLSRALAALLAPTYDDWEPVLREAGLQHLLVRRGSMTVYESEHGLAADALDWKVKRERGIRVQRIGASEIREREPALAPVFPCAMLAPEWGHVRDPYRLVAGVAGHLRNLGGGIRRAEVREFAWRDGRPAAALTGEGEALPFDRLVIAAGAWSRPLARRLGSRVPLDTERGYNTTLPQPGVQLNDMVTFGERHFVLTPMEMGLRIGGAVELAGLDAPPNFARSRALLALARRFLPGLNCEGGQEWMGCRPSLPDSVPVIGASPKHGNVIFAFGHGHLGLTMAATTARMVAALARGDDPGIDMRPYRPDRF